MKATLKVTKDITQEVNDAIKRFKNDKVLVGIPETTAERKKEENDGEITNAALLATANFGSPANNIPPWPVMALGIRNAKTEIAAQFAGAVKSTLKGGFAALDQYYGRAGLIASNSIKKVINTQEGVPSDKPSPATLAARKAEGFKGTKYWIRTGQMRNAITYVIRGGKK
jgi:hypothetical protein